MHNKYREVVILKLIGDMLTTTVYESKLFILL